MIVLDTNVLSEAMKPSPDRALARWMVRERSRGLFTTAVSEAEIIYGMRAVQALDFRIWPKRGIPATPRGPGRWGI